jgi:hypothetical protein
MCTRMECALQRRSKNPDDNNADLENEVCGLITVV